MTETTPPQEISASNPQANPNAPRQKQSFRRRRKRRGPGANPAQGAPPNGPQQNGSAPSSDAGAAPQNLNPQNSNSQSNGTPRSNNQPRKPKKRFFKKGSGQGQNSGQNMGQNPGNGQQNGRNAGNNGQQQRRGSKQRRAPKVFVGPMDHSYRAANGNYADAPPSTIELQRGYSNSQYNGNGNGNGISNVNGNSNGNYSANVSGSLELMGSSTAGNAAQADLPARIYCFIDDLFFIAKIQETARKLGIKVSFVKNDKETVAAMLALPETERPTLIVVDLNNVNAKPLALIPKLKLKLKRATSIVGFLSHLQGELKAKAIEAGCDTVMPRSAFSQTLPNLLRRYGVEVEEDLTQVAEA